MGFEFTTIRSYKGDIRVFAGPVVTWKFFEVDAADDVVRRHGEIVSLARKDDDRVDRIAETRVRIPK